MNKEILSWLESSGLDQRRAKIYLTLLMLGESRASELARQSGVSRTAIYDNIRALEDHGYVRKSTNGKSFSYQAISPQELRDRQHQQLNQLEVVLPALQMLSNSAVTGEFVQVFRGATSANHIFEDILREKPKEYCYLSNPVETYKTINRRYITQWIKTRVQKNISARAIRTLRLTSNEDRIFVGEVDYKREIRYLPQKIELSATIYIYGNTVGIIASHREEKSMLIRSKDLATSLQQIFEVLWAISAR